MTATTLRALTGVAPTLHTDGPLPAGIVVLFIDYQHEYAAGPLALPGQAAASEAARRLRAWAAAHRLPLIHVLHHAVSPQAPFFAPGLPGAEPLPGLAPALGETTVVKRLPSAFAGTGLADELQALGAEFLLLAGLMTHNCVDATARDAFHRGYRVGIVSDACASRNLPGPDGTPVAAATVHAAVLAGLGDRIAEITDCATLASLRPPA